MYRTALASVLIMGSAVGAHAAAYYDFETYTLGPVSGQDGWTSTGTATIISVLSQQSLQIAQGTATHGLTGSGFGNVTNISYLTAITDGSNSYSEVILNDSGPVEYAHLGINNQSDYFYWFDNSGLHFNTPNSIAIDPDTIYAVDVTLDFGAQKYRATVTDVVAATLKFDTGYLNFVTSTTSALGEAGALTFGGGDVGQSAIFDNLSISSVPEPSSALLATFGALGIAIARRRKSSGNY